MRGLVNFALMGAVALSLGTGCQVWQKEAAPPVKDAASMEQAMVPEERLIVLSTHVPLGSFADPTSTIHQTDNLPELYALLGERPALSLSGHTHSLENHAPGQHFAGWEQAVGIERLPFRHIVAGAASGAWWQGDFDIDGVPMSLQRFGAPKGVLDLAFDDAGYRERYIPARIDPERQQWLGFSTPAFRDWFEAIDRWRQRDAEERDRLPPLSINDLPDTRLLTPGDLEAGVWLTANVWLGSAEARLTATLDDGKPMPMERTQAGAGEAARVGAEWADPFATQRQLSVARYALESRSGEPRNQGIELFRGNRIGPAVPQPMGSVADRNMHLWRWRLPEALPEGVHRLQVEAVDRHGERTTEITTFEVRSERPAPRWRSELWD